MPPRPLSVHALAQALADVRPPADPSGQDPTWVMWLATARSIEQALPEDFAHNFVLLCKTLTPPAAKGLTLMPSFTTTPPAPPTSADAAAREMLRILPLLHHTVSALSLLSHEVKDLRPALQDHQDATVAELCQRLALIIKRMTPPTPPAASGSGDLGALSAVAWAWERYEPLEDYWLPVVAYAKPEESYRLRNIRPLYEAPAAPRTGSGVSVEEAARLATDLRRTAGEWPFSQGMGNRIAQLMTQAADALFTQVPSAEGPSDPA